ncbi:MAG TPA: DUF1350 family protein [Thermosynechococcaceae cyanobacterium]
MDWQEISGNWVLVPPRPIAILHFLGGAFVATAPHITYRRLLERLALQGYVVVATPFVNTFDHRAIAQTVLRNFDRAVAQLYDTQLRRRSLPVYGVGHSMGCKLHLLTGSLFGAERAGNILVSFNNYSARDAVPLVEQFTAVFSQFSAEAMEFTPSPRETNQIVADKYTTRRNLLIKFTNDTLDQSAGLTEILQRRFPEMSVVRTLPGTHLTPLGPDVDWKVGGSFTPFDALGQWFRQEVYRELHELERVLLQWLNPLTIR